MSVLGAHHAVWIPHDSTMVHAAGSSEDAGSLLEYQGDKDVQVKKKHKIGNLMK